MSEVDLTAFAESSNARMAEKVPTPMQEVNLALQACSFGRFHLRLLFSVMVTMTAGVLVTNTTPYLLPTAECDLNMGLVDKGILNAAPYVGMAFSSIVAGFLTDTFGRKIFIIYGNLGIFIFTVVAGTSQTFEVLIAAKFCEGFLFGAAFSATVTMTSEFCHESIRDRIMLCQSACVACAQVYVAMMSWGILINEWKYEIFNGFLVLNTWNFYLYLMSLWSLTSCILYCFLPESPKYLVSQKKYYEARQVLISIYTENTGKTAESFPYFNLWKTNKVNEVIDEALEIKIENSLSHQIVVGLHNVKSMFQKPLVFILLGVCCMNFLIMFMYNVIRLWFPQLSTIVENYITEDSADLCVVLDAYTSDLRLRRSNLSSSDVCVPTKIGTETYVNSIILGTVCLIPYFISGILVNKLGKKFLQVCGGIISVLILLGVRFSNTKVAVVALFSIGTAAAQMMMSLTQAMTVQNFPTTTRTLAISINMTIGRIGSLVGNVIFPILLNIGCVVPFYTLAGIMIGATLIAIFIPSKK